MSINKTLCAEAMLVHLTAVFCEISGAFTWESIASGSLFLFACPISHIPAGNVFFLSFDRNAIFANERRSSNQQVRVDIGGSGPCLANTVMICCIEGESRSGEG